MTAELWITLIVGLLGGGGLIKLFIKLGDWFHHRRSVIIFSDITKIYDAMGEIVRRTRAERVLVFMTHNDGAEISPAKKMYASVLYELVIKPFKSIKAEYQHLPLDGHYVKLLLNVLTNTVNESNTKDMDVSMLKGIYAHEGVKFAQQHYLADSKRKKMWYLSVATSQDITSYEDYEKIIIQKNAEIISTILKKYS